MRRCIETVVLTIRASRERFERIEWILVRVHGPHATINLCPEASGCFNNRGTSRRSARHHLSMKLTFVAIYLLNINCSFSCSLSLFEWRGGKDYRE